MKKGFTLMELLVVIVIVAVISVSSVLAFGNIDDSTAVKDRINIYKDIQRSAILYVDLNNSWLNQFREKGYMYIGINELINTNHVDSELEDPVTGDKIPRRYLIKIYTAKDKMDNDYIDTCILDKASLSSVYCNKDVRKCCTAADLAAVEGGLNNCWYINASGNKSYYENAGSEDQACLNDIDNCSCYSEMVCKEMSCVANSDGENYNCCANE